MINIAVHPKAKIAENVVIEPFTYISEHVEIGEGTWIGPNVTIFDYVRIGKNCKIFPGAVLGAVPQDLKFAGEETYVEIGDNTTIRECVTINRGTAASGKYKTVVGSNCIIMSYVHIAHDCRVSDNCVFSSYAAIAGETDVDEWAILGGGALVHQFTHIGAHSMLGGGSATSKDIPPYILSARNPASYEGINIVGLRRRGFSNTDIEEIHNIYRILMESNLMVTEACNQIREQLPESRHKQVILDFIANSKRGIIKKDSK